MVGVLKSLVELESPTQSKKGVDACAAFLIKDFKGIGAGVRRFAQEEIGDLHLVEYAPAGLKNAPERILVLLHLDTVWPIGKIKRMPFYVSGDKAFGPGALDMKAGSVMTWFALSTIHRLGLKPNKRIAILMNSTEETGHEAGRAIIREQARKSDMALCLEPSLPGGALKQERKGRLVVRLEASGKSAHAGSPDKGASAIEELILHLGNLSRIRKRETTVNIGRIEGGEMINTVADKAWAALDIRFWKNVDKENVRKHFHDLEPLIPGTGIKAVFDNETPPLEITRASMELFARVSDIAAGLGMTLKGGKTGGGSDGSVASAAGIPVLDGLGPDGNGIHAENEHVLISSLVERTALLTEIFTKL